MNAKAETLLFGHQIHKNVQVDGPFALILRYNPPRRDIKKGPQEIDVTDWYYIGHYGQLGPLTVEQMKELIEGGVIVRETYVWRSGMTDWVGADQVPDLNEAFRAAEPFAAPPPPPLSPRPFAQTHPVQQPSRPYGSESMLPQNNPYAYPAFGTIKSDRSRTVGGILQLVLPGVGRMYLGYAAVGVIQLVLCACAGVGFVWSFVDGIIILTGGVRMDGYGRQLGD